MAEAGTTYKATGLDLSELQLASAIFRNGGAPETLVGALQAGEGYHNASANPNLGLDDGGLLTYGVTVFAAGIGPTLESLAEYRNTGVYTGSSTTHADDPVYMVTVIRKAEDGKTSDGTAAGQAADTAPTTSKETVEYLTQSQIDALDEDESVISYKRSAMPATTTRRTARRSTPTGRSPLSTTSRLMRTISPGGTARFSISRTATSCPIRATSMPTASL